MSFNAAAAERLERIGVLMDLLGEDSFRAAAHARAARALADLARDASTLHKDELVAIQGIGAKTADKIIEFARTGAIAELDELAAKVPKGLLDVLAIPGLGPKTVRTLWQQGGVTDIASLQKIIDDGSILALPRMGAKSVDKIRESLAFAQQHASGGRTWLGLALPLGERVAALVRALPGVARAEYAGSLRRGKETIGDIDVLVALAPGAEPAAVAGAFRGLPGVVRVLASGDHKSSVMMDLHADMGRWAGDDDAGSSPNAPSAVLQVDLKIVPPESFGAALMYFTGSKEHNVAMRQRALDRGMTLNEYGLFPEDHQPTPPQSRGIAPVAAREEIDVFHALGLPFIPPEAREHRGELALAETPRLLELADIRAELHAHTTASDGAMSIEELARAAHARGFHTIAVTDHSKSSAIAGGLSPERLKAHILAIRQAQSRLHDAGVPIRLLAGSEVDILADGTLDYDDDLLAQLDLVVASPHASTRQDPATATARLLRAIRHPLVHILGHPTARLINRRPGLSPDIDALVHAAAEARTALEINAHWLRLDLRDFHARAAVDAGCMIAVDCDVHRPEDFDNLRFGVLTARRGMVTPDRCVNAMDATALAGWLRAKR